MGIYKGYYFGGIMKLPKIELSQKPTYKTLGQNIDFYKLFQKIEQQFETCFIFESLGAEGNFSRYSLMGFDPRHIISARENTLIVDEEEYKVKNPYFTLRDIMPEPTIARNYAGGLIGYLGYDAVNYFEPSISVKTHEKFPTFLFGVYTDGIILDKLTNELLYFYHDEDRSPVIKKILKSQYKKTSLTVISKGDSLSKKEHKQHVEEVKKEIRLGNTFQCEVGFKTEFALPQSNAASQGDALRIYEKLRKVNPSPFMYYLKFKKFRDIGDIKIIGASPELLFGLRNGEMQTRPLAGTIRRGKNQKEDQKLARQLLNDKKEIAEHNMLVDLHRNDIGRVAEFGTVKVRDLMSVKKFSHVQHISSEIVGILKRGEDMFSALAVNFPTGTLSGAPKIESMKIINRLEKEARGPYGGGVGQFGFNGDCTFAIAIRSLFISGEYAFAQTSGGIVYDSIPEKEYQEIKNKLAAIKNVLEKL